MRRVCPIFRLYIYEDLVCIHSIGYGHVGHVIADIDPRVLIRQKARENALRKIIPYDMICSNYLI